MIVVFDTSLVLNLSRIGRLELLPLLYREVLISDAVYRELIDSERDLPPAIDITSLPWLIVAAAKDQNRVLELRERLDPGEAEAIVLAIERRADVLLVDERRGRRIATAEGLTVTGLLGVVVRAKEAGQSIWPSLARPLELRNTGLVPAGLGAVIALNSDAGGQGNTIQ